MDEMLSDVSMGILFTDRLPKINDMDVIKEEVVVQNEIKVPAKVVQDLELNITAAKPNLPPNLEEIKPEKIITITNVETTGPTKTTEENEDKSIYMSMQDKKILGGFVGGICFVLIFMIIVISI